MTATRLAGALVILAGLAAFLYLAGRETERQPETFALRPPPDFARRRADPAPALDPAPATPREDVQTLRAPPQTPPALEPKSIDTTEKPPGWKGRILAPSNDAYQGFKEVARCQPKHHPVVINWPRPGDMRCDRDRR